VVVAAAKPVFIGEPIEIRSPARDFMIAVDLSGSMAEEDFSGNDSLRLSRLDGAKQVLLDLAQRREGDRLGLMVFADAPFLQLTFSQDTRLFQILLEQSQVRMAGAKTMLGDAIGFAYNHFINSHSSKHQGEPITVKRVLL
jgi:Ca-activated chloride channel family protein